MIITADKYMCHHHQNARWIGRSSIHQSFMCIILILTILRCDVITNFVHVAAFSSSDVLSSSRCSFVKVVPSHQPQHPPSTFHLRSEQCNNIIRHRNQYSASLSSSSIRRTSTIPNTMLFTYNSPYYPLLDVALDQPLYTPIRRYFWDSSVNFLLLRINSLLNYIMGFLPALLHTLNNLVLSNAMTPSFYVPN
jgi:hypothetical protein